MEERLNIAIQKSGRLNEDSVKILQECGIKIDNSKEQLKAQAHNFPLDLLYLRNSDIPQYIEDGVADIAIIGENLVVEKAKNIKIVEKLGFSKCKLSLAVPKSIDYKGLDYFNGKKLATSYPNTLKKFLDKNNLDTEIHIISGSVEIAPNIGLADGICDLVSSGSTLFKNRLKEVRTILKSEACLVANKNIPLNKQNILKKLQFRLTTVLRARTCKYVLLNAENKNIKTISAILPGLESPTVMPLKEKGWSVLHSVIEEDQFWERIDQLKKAGARDILVMPIEKIIQ